MELIPVAVSGPSPRRRAFHTCSAVGDKLFVFGGVSDGKEVLEDMCSFDVSCSTWTQIPPSTGLSSRRRSSSHTVPSMAPALSHHSAVALDEQTLVLIGGWNGKKRTAGVFFFDTVNHSWKELVVNGDIPVGLSSHTTNLVSRDDVLIVGREGGVHMQRRFSGAFSLNLRTGRYTEAPYHASSRAGHSANLIHVRSSKEYTLLITGGRSSGGYEFLGRWKNIPHGAHCSPALSAKVTVLLSRCTACGEPSGRQHCRVAELGRYLLFYGGETWSGVRNNVTREMYILDTAEMRWYKVPVSDSVPRLTGHSLTVLGEDIFVVGGLLDNKYTDTLWRLKF